MKLPAYKRIYYTDFPQEDQEIIEQLSYTINNGFEGVYNALNNGLSLEDNLDVSVKDVLITVDATGIPTSPTSYTVTNSNPIDGTQVIRALNQTNSTVFPTGGIFISYTQSGNKVTINNITGLPANNQFSVRIISYLT